MRSSWARLSCAPRTRARPWRRCSAAETVPQAQQSLIDEPQVSRLERLAPEEWKLAPGWQPVVDAFFASSAGLHLAGFIRARLAAGAVIYPPRPLRALEITPLDDVHAVILGQDPYHGAG